MANVHSYVSGEQNCQNEHIPRYHSKIQFLTTSPVRERDSCLPLKAMDFPKSHVLKRLVKKVIKDEKIRKNNARHAGETHNNNCHGFGAYRFTCVRMKILRVKIGNVSFTIEKVTLFWAKSTVHAFHRQQ